MVPLLPCITLTIQGFLLSTHLTAIAQTTQTIRKQMIPKPTPTPIVTDFKSIRK